MLNKNYPALLMLLVTLSQSTNASATSTDKTTCEEVIKAADSALEAKNKEIDFSIRVITTQDTELTRVRQDLRDEKARNDVWYKNPSFLILLGLVSGAVLAK